MDATTRRIPRFDHLCDASDADQHRAHFGWRLAAANNRPLARAVADQVTIVIVTHNMQQAARVSNQCAFFLAEQGTPGGIVEHGATDAIFSNPQDQRTADYVNGRFG